MMDATRWVFLGLLMVGCASVATPFTDSPDSPAHSDAQEAITPPPAPSLSGSAQLAREDDEHAEHDSQQDDQAAGDPPEAKAVYSCPMHPEVTSDEPGTCPKCGMKLVPTESEEHSH